MLFNSPSFLVFFVLLLAIGFLSPKSWIKHLILIASLIFYAYWYPPYLILLLISVAIDYYCCLALERKRSTTPVYISAILNLAILFGFKYIHFFLGIFDIHDLDQTHWALPLGISFFTFQTMACTIDVYRGETEAKKNFWDFLLYICFFPQLIAGPILRLKDDWQSVTNPHKPGLSSLNTGIYLIFWGLCKKMLIADNLAGFVEQCFDSGLELSTVMAWLGVYAFAVQIYCDFSGYVDTAIGVAQVFGIKIPINFNFPYFSQSITEFWRRWHITLSTWLKDYLYIPFGGNRNGNLSTYKNLLITMILGGLWHGSNWTFVIWGLLHGLYLSIEKPFRKEDGKASLWKYLLCFHAVCLSWVFFRARDLEQAWNYLKSLFVWDLDLNLGPIAEQSLILMLVVLILHHLNYRFDIKNTISTWRLEFRLAFLLFAVVAIMLFGVKQEVRFIYFDF